jgi:hypothetical protein
MALEIEGEACPSILEALEIEGEGRPSILEALEIEGKACPSILEALEIEGEGAPSIFSTPVRRDVAMARRSAHVASVDVYLLWYAGLGPPQPDGPDVPSHPSGRGDGGTTSAGLPGPATRVGIYVRLRVVCCVGGGAV